LRLSQIPLALVLIQGVLGCAPPAAIEGRPCPCVRGFVCCDRLNLCYPPEQARQMSCQVEGASRALPDADAGVPGYLPPVDGPPGPEVTPPLLQPDGSLPCPTGKGWQRCADDTCVRNGCCSDEDCGVCQTCSGKICKDQTLGQDRRNECAGRGCSAGRCRECLPAELPVCLQGSVKSCSPEGFYKTEVCELGCSGTSCITCSAPVTCHRDEDKDGFGDPAVSKRVCGSCPQGYVQDSRDCYDHNPMAYPRGPTDGFEDWFPVHRGDGSFDYTCDGMVETSPPDPDRAVCVGVRPSCDILRMGYDASKCGTLVLAFSCSCNPECVVACRVLGGGRLQIGCR
jgi:hypothetical protein